MPDTYTVVVRNEPVRVVQVGTAGPQGPQGEQGEPGADGSPTAEAVAALVEATTPTAAAGLDATDRVAVTVDTALGSVTLDVLLQALWTLAATGSLARSDGTDITLMPPGASGYVRLGNDTLVTKGGGGAGGVGTVDSRAFHCGPGQSDIRVKLLGYFDCVLLGSGTVVSWGTQDNLGGDLGGSTGIGRAATGVVEVNAGTQGSAGKTLRSIPLTPSQITADQNNYAPGVARNYRLSTDASRTLTGLSVGQVDGQECRIFNAGSNDLVLANQSASSTAANRFLTHTGADLTLTASQSAGLVYDATTARWRTHP